MITKMKKKFASCIAIVCAIMILIGIFPTNIFGSSNTVDAAGNMTVYFDNSSGAWSGSSTISVYWLIGSGGSGPIRMTSVTGRTKLYSAEVPSNASGLIFINGTGWSDYPNQTVNIKWDSNKVYHEGKGGDGGTYTITIVSHTLTDGMCFRLNGNSWSDGADISKKLCDQVSGFTPPTTSLAGKPIYVKDMVGDAIEVTATFYASEQTSVDPITQPLAPEGGKKGSYLTTIPADVSGKPYDTVEISYTTADGTYSNNVKYGIMGQGNSISNSYFNYDENNCNTYYIRAYGDDEETERMTSCYWERRLGATDLYSGVYAGTGAYRLYFDSKDFDDENAIIKFGYNGGKVSETKLVHDDTTGMYYYEITSSPTLTQDDVITVRSGGKEYRMFWFDMNNNIATVTTLSNPNGTAAFISDLYKAGSKRIYFDATMSKLSYEGDTTAGIKSGMGASVMYCSYGSANASSNTNIPMKKAEPHSNGKNTWNDVYYIDVADTVKYIRFGAASGSTSSYGSKTAQLQIPTGLTKPCFYADSSDNVIYDNGTRSGYWGEVYTIRDAETGKEGSDVVDIKKDTFTKNSDRMYVNSTFYDYYSDYELNGNNRDNYRGTLPAGAQYYNYDECYRHWNIYRQFDQALSDYYKTECPNTRDPLYEGHIQPAIRDWGQTFATIAGSLGLFYGNGLSIGNRFYANNNSAIDYNGKGYADELTPGYPASRNWSAVVQDLTEDKLSNGNIIMKNTETILPFFNERFLSGDNSKNAKLGEIYKNVSFPFEKYTPIRDEDGKDGNDGVEYWHYNANEKTLAMRQDTTTNEYYLHEYSNTQPWSINKNASSEDQSKHGFFPFNEPSGGSSGKNATQYNYGYGMKLEFNFRLTSDGQVLGTDGNKHPIMFRFSGDDDVWVYIDGKLALDLGGAHGESEGIINFANNKAAVSAVKASPLSTDAAKDGYTNADVVNPTIATSITLEGDSISGSDVTHSTTTEHTLVMYYMERGQWESNLSVEFNFPDNNELAVEKNVDYSEVNYMFKPFFETNSNFAFTIQNYATHYGTVPVDTATFDTATTFASAFANFGTPTDTSTKAEKTTDSGSFETVIHWSSTAENNNRTQTDSRLVTINPDSGGTVSAKDCEYMRFKIKPASSGGVSNTLALSKMYIRFTDRNGNTARGYLTSSRLMGVPDIKADEFSIVRVLFDKLNTDKGVVFGWEHIESIGFQYDDPADIYISEFVFQPQPNLSESTGFVTNQYEIPDYGSVKAGGLTNVTGAVYTTDNATPTDTGDDSLRVVGNDSQFFLKNNETVAFSDQFRRGSYIYLNEELTDKQKALFDTTYTVYEDGKPVNQFVNTTNVQNGDKTTLVDQPYTSVDDDRTENHATGTVDGREIANTGYTSAQQPDKDSFVFRSYLTNESGTGAGSLTKLKVVYTNKAKVATLKITKGKADGSKELDGTYKFYVEFYNVGGVALEDDTIITEPYEITNDGSIEITGIPVGTQFTIHEVQPTDGSSLKEVKCLKDSSEGTTVEIKNDTITVKEGGEDKTYNTRSVSGSIDDGSTNEYNYKMLNYKYTVMVEIEKKWDNTTSIEPLDISEVQFKVQYRTMEHDGEPAGSWEYVKDSSDNPVVITVSKDKNTGVWNKGTGGPYDFYVDNDPDNAKYEYRVVELNQDGTEVADGGIYKYDDMSFNVTYDPETAYVEESSPPVDNTLKFKVTNTYVETTEYNAVKEWYDEKGTNLTVPDVGTQLTLKLQSTTNDSAGATDWKDEKTVTVKFDGTGLTLDPSVDDVECSLVRDSTNVNSKWKVIFKNLPEKDTDGTTLHYRVIEDPVPLGYTQMTEDYNNDEDTKTSTIKNKKVPTLTAHKVTKRWPDGLPEEGKEITLQLKQTTEDTPSEEDWTDVDAASATDNKIIIKYGSDGITVKKSEGASFSTDENLTSSVVDGVNEWYYQWNNLPATDKSTGKKIKYRVVETNSCEGYSPASQTYDETGSVIVNKKVVEMPSAGSIPFIFNFALFGGIVIAISLVILHLNRKFNIFQRIMRNFKGV